MNPPRDKKALQALIDGQIEESQHLDYKAAGSLDRSDGKKKEVTKDVSAFANAAGGVIVYGIKEKPAPDNHLPDGFDPVNRRDFTKEWLDQIVGQIQPKIEGLEIIPVRVGPGSHDYCYVVEIPQSGTAHQARDLRYYKRANFESVPMQDYEIRDVMNRRKHPKITVEFRWQATGLVVRLHNIGLVMAYHFLVEVGFPTEIEGRPVCITGPEGHAALADRETGSYWSIRLFGPPHHPLFPGSTEVFRVGVHHADIHQTVRNPSVDFIRIRVFADAMTPFTVEAKVIAARQTWISSASDS